MSSRVSCAAFACPSLVAEGLTCTLPSGAALFHDLDLAIGPGFHGLVGPNGAGKSTLLALLAGRRPLEAGRVSCAGAVGLLEQLPPPGGAARVADALGVGGVLDGLARLAEGDAAPEVYDAIGDAWDAPERASAQLARLGLDGELTRPLATLSGGEHTRVRLARLLLEAPEVLLLDEPTNHLDRAARAACAEALRGYRGALLVASHDRELLERAGAILELRAGRLARVGGGHAEYADWRAAEDAAAERALEAREQTLARERRDAARAADRQRHRSADGKRRARASGVPAVVMGAMQRRAQETAGRSREVHQDRIERAATAVREARDRLPLPRRLLLDLPDTTVPESREVLSARSLSAGWNGPLWPAPLELRLVGPARVAITGENGAGKSTLLRLLAGQPAPTGLTVHGALTLREPAAYLDQEAALLDRSLTLAANLAAHAPQLPEPERRARLGRFLFEQERALVPAGALSGGERVRAALCCVLARSIPPRLLVLDEPTNHLDLDGLEALESALQSFRGALVVASHDERFLAAIGVTRRVTLARA